MQNLGEAQTRQGCVVGRLHDDGAAHGNRGGNLMHDEIQGMVECTDRNHNTDRFLSGHSQPVRG